MPKASPAKNAKTVAAARAKPKRPALKVDPITLSVVRGVLETTQREMTLSLEKTARSSVFNLAHDYSTALFNARPEMILQGQDIPIHLGSLIPAMKAVANIGSISPRLAVVSDRMMTAVSGARTTPAKYATMPRITTALAGSPG